MTAKRRLPFFVLASRAALVAALAQATACGADSPGPDTSHHGTLSTDARAPNGSGGDRDVGGAQPTGGAGGRPEVPDDSGTPPRDIDGGSFMDAGSAPIDAGPPPRNVDMDAALFGDSGPPPLVCDGTGARFATGVVAYRFGPGQNFGQGNFPAALLGPPKGGGACQGSLDVVSLGNGGYVVLEFAGNAIVDGPGADFIVFENPFEVGCDPSDLFAELGTVAVSDDGKNWTDFPCTATAPPYGECSGWHVVYANADTNTIDPTDPSVAGGDAYDLADIGVKEARYVRVTDRPDLVGTNGVYDLDAVSIVHPLCP